MRLVSWKNGIPEAAAWQGLPARLQASLPREKFLHELHSRKDRYANEIQEVLKNSGFGGICKVINEGDWHDGQCVLVVEGSDGRRIVVKPRCNEASQLTQAICDRSKFAARFGVSVPLIQRMGNFWVQEYIQPSERAAATSASLGGVAALTLWGGLTDLHDENLVFSGEATYLVDLECAFEFSGAWTPLSHFEASGLITGKRPGFGRVELHDYRKRSIRRAALSALSSLLHETAIDLYERVDAIALRRVFIATRIYMAFLRQRFLFGWSTKETRCRWQHVRSANPVHASVLRYELMSLCQWSVPIFYQRGPDVFDGRNERVYRCEPASVAMRRSHQYLRDNGILEPVIVALCTFVRGQTRRSHR